MLTATLLALGAAVLHAGWNLAAKTAGDRFAALWGQFASSGLVVLVPFLVLGGMPARAWIWAVISGLVHVPYVVYLARAYETGEFSIVYPIARSGGASLAAIGGVLLLDDHISVPGWFGIAIITLGLLLLTGSASGVRPDPRSVVHALVVAATVGVYSVSDARGIRTSGTIAYALATFLASAVFITAYGVISGRWDRMRTGWLGSWRRYLFTGLVSVVTYTMIQLAFRRAAVGYVTGLRESSVVIAALVGWRFLGERGGARRVIASLVVLVGLIVLVLSR